MICQNCHAEQASVHVQQSLNGTLSEMHLCQKCAQELKLNGFSPFMVAGFLQSLLGASAANVMQETGQETTDEQACPSCHTSAARIQHTGFVGCADCYIHFANQMDKWLQRIQGQVRHVGKAPKRYESAIREAANLENLKTDLKRCIEKEDFEEAAVLRDRIREMENQAEGEKVDD